MRGSKPAEFGTNGIIYKVYKSSQAEAKKLSLEQDN